MPMFTIESTYLLPVYRHRTYKAATVEAACALALNDDEWEDAEHDYDCSGPTYVSGAWAGEDSAYAGPTVAFPAKFARDTADPLRNAAPAVLAALKLLRGDIEIASAMLKMPMPDSARIADAAIAKAEGRE